MQISVFNTKKESDALSRITVEENLITFKCEK